LPAERIAAGVVANQLGESFSKIAQVISEGKTELQRRN
jgi:hypothetical protein